MEVRKSDALQRSLRSRKAAGLSRRSGTASRCTLVGAICLGTCLPAAAGQQHQPASENDVAWTLSGFTAPARVAVLAAVQPGLIAQIHVREGDVVVAGTLLAELDARVHLARLEMAQHAAQAAAPLDLARVRLRRAELDHGRVHDLGQNASPREIANAELDLEEARCAVRQAEEALAANQLNTRLQTELLNQMRIVAPFDGYVARLSKQAGEAVEEREPLLTLVDLSELEVVADCPIDRAATLANGMSVRVCAILPPAEKRNGRIVFVSRVADAASQTARIRVRVDNRERPWIAGLRVTLSFESDLQAAAARGRTDAPRQLAPLTTRESTSCSTTR